MITKIECFIWVVLSNLYADSIVILRTHICDKSPGVINAAGLVFLLGSAYLLFYSIIYMVHRMVLKMEQR